MPSHFVCLSDLHMGYDRSVLTDLGTHAKIAGQIAEIAGGSTKRLILNGDCFEACVPLRVGEHDAAGFPTTMAAASQRFLGTLLNRMTADELVILWGNHDYCLWQRLALACGVPTFTNYRAADVCLLNKGHILPGAESFVHDVIGSAADKLRKITAAYPNYILGRQWPFIVFHHGHLLDKMVLGWDEAVDYLGLKAIIGQGSSKVSPDGEDTLKTIHEKTEAFISAMWRYNSPARADEWKFLRRFSNAVKCRYHQKGGCEVVNDEVQGDGLGNQAKWYLDVLATDPMTPAILGEAAAPSYFFVGHDHGGGQLTIPGLDRHDWKLVNTGGWTKDRDTDLPHAHVVVWRDDVVAEGPTTYCVGV